jgi:hypothetical protein
MKGLLRRENVLRIMKLTYEKLSIAGNGVNNEFQKPG